MEYNNGSSPIISLRILTVRMRYSGLTACPVGNCELPNLAIIQHYRLYRELLARE